ncbi:alkaline phosphatase family protein [Pseudoalteromonas aurantia]|nr:alkaline phosphatase family protein [Pseudoalteromonas aurantia]
MNNIKHVVYLMLENRSFDNVLGWLYDDNHPPKVTIPAQEKPTYDGLKPTYFNLDQQGNKHYVIKGTNNNMHVPSCDPHEEYSHVNKQLFGHQKNPNKLTQATMSGFYQDFSYFSNPAEEFSGVVTDEIMMSYTPKELPVLNGLAKNFAVSDRYFSSVPTQTNCNRAFAACGNSLGLNNGKLEAWVNNRNTSLLGAGHPEGQQFNQKTFWNVLSEHGKNTPADWIIYNSSGSKVKDLLGVEGYSYTRDLMEQLQDKSFDPHFSTMDSFFKKAADGQLPSVSFLEPEWGGGFSQLLEGQGNDYHPPTNLAPGEAFVKQIYDALTANPQAWEKTLFIINFDEHGGTYDHVPPPWNAAPPWQDDDTTQPELYEHDFKFDRFGVRVPLILVSPWVPESCVFRSASEVPFDHTSVIATILKMMGIPKSQWGLGSRTANAPTFEHVFSSNALRKDIPTIDVNPFAHTNEAILNNTAKNDIQTRRDHFVEGKQGKPASH